MTYSRRVTLDAGTHPSYGFMGIPGTHSRSAVTFAHHRPSRRSQAHNNPGITSSCGHLIIRTHTGTGKSANGGRAVRAQRVTAQPGSVTRPRLGGPLLHQHPAPGQCPAVCQHRVLRAHRQGLRVAAHPGLLQLHLPTDHVTAHAYPTVSVRADHQPATFDVTTATGCTGDFHPDVLREPT